MSTPTGRRLLASSALAAALWLVFAVVRWALSQLEGPAAQLAALIPAVVPTGLLWGASGVWLFLAVVVGAVAVALVHASVVAVVVRATTGAAAPVAAWFGAVVAGAVVGLALDLTTVWSALADYGPRGLLVGEFGAAAAAGALWGVTVGWMPALVARTPASARAAMGTVTWGPMSTLRPTRLAAAASVALLAVIATGVAVDTSRTAALEAEDAARQQAEAATTFGALPDPEAPGVPVPAVADGPAVELDPEWCTPDKAMLLKGEPDAATGHRGLPIRLTNFSEQPCVIEGYPDIAFGDQNQHLLAVTIEHGGSFMAQDAGPQRIAVPAGGTAVAVIGWDAASPHGALVTRTVYAAPTPGMARGSWPMDLDIVEGSTVAVTAWAIDANPAGTD